MDNQPVQQPVSPQANEDPRFWKKYQKLFLIGAGVIVLILIALIVFLGRGKDSSNTQTGTDKAVAKVGQETIYQSDLDKELAAYPNVPDAQKIVLDKMIDDSITLQAGQKDNLIKLNSDIYNNSNKNYTARIDAVQKVQEDIAKEESKIKGTVVAIWFYNTRPASIGLEQGRALAQQKITTLWQQVKNGTLTKEEAGKRIQDDTTLAQVDSQYKSNAIYTFDTAKGEKITFDENANNILENLKQGEVSDVILANDKGENGTSYPALYLFGKVTDNTLNSSDSPDYQ